jgi:hypothetical protein
MPKLQKLTAHKLISEADMKSLEHQPLGEEFIRMTVTQDTECWDEQGRCVFVYLRGVIPAKHRRPAFLAADKKLKFNSTNVSQRAALKGVGGGELNFGWSDTPERIPKWLKQQLRPEDLAKRNDFRLFAPTYQQREHWMKFEPLVESMNRVFQKHLPSHWQTVDSRFTGRSDEHNTFEPSCEAMFRLFASVCFSTATLLKSAPSKLHKDSKNADAGLTCLTTLGKFTGGSLLFPQYGLEIPVQPGDLIIAATHREWHCNVRKRIGTRYSLITYYRERLVDKVMEKVMARRAGA